MSVKFTHRTIPGTVTFSLRCRCRDDMSNRQRNCMKSILFADDEESLRILISATLDYPDHQIVEASDGDGSSSET
jgi:hypothetical protein